MASLNVGSINMYDGVYQNSMPDIRYYAQELKKRNIKPFLCVFDLSMLYNVEQLKKEELIPPPFVYNFVFDVPGCLPFSEKSLGFFLNHIPNNSPWFMTRYHAKGWKDFQMALECGGHVRVGCEDSPFLSSGEMARSNADLVEEIVKAAQSSGRKVVHPDGARKILGILQKT
jgi:3-keto-5-aminohexanoate cleavage enzyme